MLLGLFSIWLCVSCALAQNSTEDATDADTTQAPQVSTTPPTLHIKFTHLDSGTDFIKFNWTTPKIFEFTYSIVKSQRSDSEAIMTSPQLTEQEYMLEDLRRETKYNVCVTIFQEGEEYSGYEQCTDFDTIKLIRDDSLIALFCVIGFLLLCILGGYLCWKYQQKKLEQEEEDGDEGENAKLNNAHGNPVSIEDRDIPFITPPPEELTAEERKEYEKAAKA